MSLEMSALKKPLNESGTVLDVINRLGRDKKAIRMIDVHSGHRFRSFVALRSQFVLVSKPGNFDMVRKGSRVRFTVPWDQRHQVELEVVNPHFNLGDSRYAFLCAVPKSFIENSGINAEKFSTTHFTNLNLSFEGKVAPFRVLELTRTSCRLAFPSPNYRRQFAEGKSLEHATLHLGCRVAVELNMVTPKEVDDTTMECDYQVGKSGEGRHIIDGLLASMAKVDRYFLSKR